jgi:superfamily II DNA/RNA helicase
MEQKERELALIQFRNGSSQILLSTDLAARGLDLPDVDYIIHYHLPLKAEEYTHRNGRTARMMRDGHIFVLHWSEDALPDFITPDEEKDVSALDQSLRYDSGKWNTIRISAGRKDKISKGDIVGFLCRKANITSDDISHIEIKDQVSYAGIHKNKLKEILHSADNQKLKVKNVRINLVV